MKPTDTQTRSKTHRHTDRPFWVSLVEDSWVDIQRVSLELRWKGRPEGETEEVLSSLQQGRPRYRAWLQNMVFSSHWSRDIERHRETYREREGEREREREREEERERE